MALFLMQTLLEAVNEMVSLESESLEALLTRLQKEEDKHYDAISRHNLVDEELRKQMKERSGYKFDELPNFEPDIDWYSLLLTGKSLCHTVRLPSQIRYRGLLTESNKTGGPSVYGEETYDLGLEIEESKALPNPEATKALQMVYLANEGQRKHKCPLVINPDEKTFFYMQYGDGWREHVIPNAATREAYHYDPSSMRGIIILVFTICDWDRCPPGFLRAKDYDNGNKWDMKINDVPVTNMTEVGNDAVVVQNDDGFTFPQDSNGGYKLEFHVNEPDYVAKITAIIVF
jgi:hypothetical protein